MMTPSLLDAETFRLDRCRRQYLPLPYMPSREAATWVSSATSLGSVGEPLRRRSMNLRASVGREGELVEAAGGDDDLVGAEGEALVGLGGEGFGVVGDVGLLDPSGVGGLDCRGR